MFRVILLKVFDEVIEVNLIDSVDYIYLVFLKRFEFGFILLSFIVGFLFIIVSVFFWM